MSVISEQEGAQVFKSRNAKLSRRSLLAAGAGVGLAAILPRSTWANSHILREHKLIAALARAPIVGASAPQTEVWAYQGTVPGPEIRIRQGERLRVLVENRLPQETTVHWHGVRMPNAMDGVPHLTQEPIAPGKTFVYEFDCRDAGTFWYHPHARSFEQVERGLAGALIVEEESPSFAQ